MQNSEDGTSSAALRDFLPNPRPPGRLHRGLRRNSVFSSRMGLHNLLTHSRKCLSRTISSLANLEFRVLTQSSLRIGAVYYSVEDAKFPQPGRTPAMAGACTKGSIPP